MTSENGDHLTSAISNVTFTSSLVNASNTTPTLTPEEQAEIDQIIATISAIKSSYLWVIFAFGFPGNLASLLIILRLRSFGSPALYVATLAVVDNIAIVVKLILLQIGEHKVALGLAGCRIMFFLGNHLVVYANWVLVTMAIERFFAVWQPLHVSRKWSSCKAAVSLGVLLLITVAFTSPLFVAVTVKADGRTCITDPQYARMMAVWQWGQVTAYGFLPCTLLITINVLIIVIISRSSRLHRSMTPSFKQIATNKNQGPPGSGIQRQATILLVVTSAVLVLTTTPISVYLLVQQWWEPQPNTVEYFRKRMTRFVLRVLCDANHSVNFYLYFISARKFRSYFCKALCWLCCRQNGTGSSDPSTRLLSASRSTLRVKDRPQGQTRALQGKQAANEKAVEGNNIHMTVYADGRQNGCTTLPCSSPL